ncbi:hypothetical protein OQY15_18205 [Pedobacter sp. MC2016-15]|uniref:hypothetical protein n=1 Tax=Pedobacter sp. MC2016-15 TaxID=2994473 RepID=UPI002247D66D|nr:hypothetical protein [Pedobacter sp. MC2016-15]MCX2481043.1 hypothetical protein [Pedobacter sp. MC2016-15]
MEQYIITIESSISYDILKNYHFTVKALYDTGNYKASDSLTPYLFDLTVTAEDKEEAELLVFNYIQVFNRLEAIHQLGNVVFITQALMNNEGTYINTEAPKNDKALLELELLVNLLSIQEEKKSDSINIEITSKRESNNHFINYSKFNNPQVVQKLIDNMVITQFNHLKSMSDSYSFDISNRLSKIDVPTLDAIKTMADQARSVSTKAFKADFLYTVCSTLRNYLTEYSHLNPDNKALTNDQARIIYTTCAIHGLLSVKHDVEVDALNYIRMVLKNKAGIEPMNAIIREDIM